MHARVKRNTRLVRTCEELQSWKVPAEHGCTQTKDVDPLLLCCVQIGGTKRTHSKSMNAHLSRDKTIPSLLNKSSGSNGNNSNVFTDEALRGFGAHILPNVTGSEPVRPEVATKDSHLVEASAVPRGPHACLAGCVCFDPGPICLRCLRADDTFIFRSPLTCCRIPTH